MVGDWTKARRFSVLGRALIDQRLHWGHDESLAFRAFDKTIIFGHWLSKTQKLALATGAFLLKKASTISQQTFFKRAKIFFQKKILFERVALIQGALLLSSHALQLSFTCKYRVGKLNFRYTFICFHIYIYIYICCALEKSFPFIKDCITYTPFLSQTWVRHCWRSHISLGISSPHLQMPRQKHWQCYPQLDSGLMLQALLGP